MEKENIKKEIISDFIMDKLYNCLELDNGKIIFDRYNLSDKEMLYMLKKFDEEKFETYSEILKSNEEK